MRLRGSGVNNSSHIHRNVNFTIFPSGSVRAVAEIGADLYDWRKVLQSGARCTRGMVHMEIRELYNEYVQKCASEGVEPSQFSGVSAKNRSNWLRAWCARYRVSFRTPSKKYTLAFYAPD